MEEHSHKITNENAKKTLLVIIFTVAAMFAEIIYGYHTKSMALLADGYHMGTHALALGLTYIAYVLIRKFENSPLFPNGTDKIGVLAAYTSSLFLGFTGMWIISETIIRLFKPIPISFNEAILVAIIGLLVNLCCIFIMENHHKHNCKKHDEEHNEDYNFKAAYYHILSDTLTSILAIMALLVGKYLNIICLDALAGFLGGFLILKWAVDLLRKTTIILIDMKNLKV